MTVNRDDIFSLVNGKRNPTCFIGSLVRSHDWKHQDDSVCRANRTVLGTYCLEQALHVSWPSRTKAGLWNRVLEKVKALSCNAKPRH